MSALDSYLDRGVMRLRTALAERGGFGEHEMALVQCVERINFPGLLGILAASEESKGPVGVELLSRVARTLSAGPRGPIAGGGRAFVERLLEAVFVHRIRPQRLVGDAGPRLDFLRRAVTEMAANGQTYLTASQADGVARLLDTGHFFGDLPACAAAVASTRPERPLAVVRGAPAALRARRIPIFVALAWDLADRPGELPRAMRELARGVPPAAPTVLPHTFAQLFAATSLATTLETVVQLVSHESDAARLSVVLYARANGIPIEESDLDVMLDKVFRTDEPDLGRAIVRALERISRTWDGPDLIRTLRRMN